MELDNAELRLSVPCWNVPTRSMFRVTVLKRLSWYFGSTGSNFNFCSSSKFLGMVFPFLQISAFPAIAKLERSTSKALGSSIDFDECEERFR